MTSPLDAKSPAPGQRHIRFELNRGYGWRTRSEGHVDATDDRLMVELARLAIQHTHRLLIDSELFAEVKPGRRARAVRS